MSTQHLISRPQRLDSPWTDGVDMLSNPLLLGVRKLHSAVNLRFEEGVVRTRPGFRYEPLGVGGQFQGAVRYAPSLGLSSVPFAPDNSALALVVDGVVTIHRASGFQWACSPLTVCGDVDMKCDGPVYLFQAENWLILHNRFNPTLFWDGSGCLTPSPGMAGDFQDTDSVPELAMAPARDCGGVLGTVGCGPPAANDPPTSMPTSCSPGEGNGPGEDCPDSTPPSIEGAYEAQDIRVSTHDTFRFDQHGNWLINSAGLGVYAHGRIHQEGDRALFVSDMIHKRGYLATDDILLMEEQALQSYGDPLGTNSKMGALKALVLLPAMNTANGEGDLIGYYENGVVSFDTFQFPRETRISGDGEILTKGWDTKRLVNHLLNSVSATGPRSVAVMPRDHFFRSSYGLHFLKLVLGDGSFNPETLNTLSQDVKPLLDSDPVSFLEGAASGYWPRGHRCFSSVGFAEDPGFSTLPYAAGFVSLNQAATFTEDRTPRPTWEGLWVLDHEMAGVHQFIDQGSGAYGFLSSDDMADVYFTSIEEGYEQDSRNGEWLPIEWSFVTGQFFYKSLSQLKNLTDGLLEGRFSETAHKIRVSIRTDRMSEWKEWKMVEPFRGASDEGQTIQRAIPLGTPPIPCREASWFQVKVEGLGFAEIQGLSVELTEAGVKAGRAHSVVVGSDEVPNYFEIHNTDPSERWPNS